MKYSSTPFFSRTHLFTAANVFALLLSLALLGVSSLHAEPSVPVQDMLPAGTALTFEQAAKRLYDASPALKAAEAQQASRRDTVDALNSLNYPFVSLDAQYLRYEKTINEKQLDIDYIKVNGTSVPLSGLGLSSFEAGISQTSFHPTVAGVWELYSGGRITASKGAARALAEQAGAQAEVARETLMLELVKAYFGQQLAEQALELRMELLSGMAEHLDNAIKLEKNGMITKAQRLQAQVACDAAKRGVEAAAHDLASARIGLAALLKADPKLGVLTSTPLFVLTGSVMEDARVLASAQDANPQVRTMQSLKKAADRNVDIARSRWKPTVYVFGSYNFYRNNELPIEPDWIGGVGLNWPIFDRIDRRKSISAARQAALAADNATEQVRIVVNAAAEQSADAVSNALRQYQLLEANQEAARENLRVQELSFREGQGTSTDVTMARVAYTNVLVERAAAAYRFDVELARLLHATGRMEQFANYMNRADKLEP